MTCSTAQEEHFALLCIHDLGMSNEVIHSIPIKKHLAVAIFFSAQVASRTSAIHSFSPPSVNNTSWRQSKNTNLCISKSTACILTRTQWIVIRNISHCHTSLPNSSNATPKLQLLSLAHLYISYITAARGGKNRLVVPQSRNGLVFFSVFI